MRPMPMPDLNQLAHDIHEENMKWWVDLETGVPLKIDEGQKEMLMISEVAEAMEGLRKGLMDDKLTYRPMAEVECADYVIRVLDHAAAHEVVFETELPKIDCSDSNASEIMLEMCACALIVYTGDRGSHAECIAIAVEFAKRFDYDLWAAVHEKRAFNRVREDHKIENRMKDGGKKW